MLCSYQLAAYKFYYTYQPVHDKTIKMTCTQRPGYPPSLTRVFAVRIKKAWVLGYPLSAQQRLIRLREWPGRSESLLSAKVILLVLSCNGSYLRDVRKNLVFVICDQLRLKPACSATETSLGLAIAAKTSRGALLYYPGSGQQKRWSDYADTHANPVFEVSASSLADTSHDLVG